MARINRERAERIARSHACENCGEYNYKSLAVHAASAAHRDALNEAWHAVKVCGVCGMQQEMGIDAKGAIVYVG